MLKLGGSHIMIVNVKHPLSEGGNVKRTLIFEHVGMVQIEYDAQVIGAQIQPHDIDHIQTVVE